MATTTPKSSNAKTKTQAKVKNSATSSPAKQPHSDVSEVGNTSFDINDMASDYILTTKHNNVPTLTAAVKNAHAKKKHEEMMALAEKLESRIFPGEMSSETIQNVIADFIRNFAKDHETAIYLCKSVGWHGAYIPARLALNIDMDKFKPTTVGSPLQDSNFLNTSALISQHYLYPGFKILLETIEENWLNGVLLRVKVSGEHEDTTQVRARRAIMQSFSVLNQVLPGFNNMFRDRGTFSRGRFYSAQYDPSLGLVPNRDFKKPVYQMLAVLESGSALPCEIKDLMAEAYINSTMSPYVQRQEPVLVRRNISHESITSSSFIANAPGIGESKITYVDFLKEWRQVCGLYAYLTHNHTRFQQAFGVFGPVLTDDFARFTITRKIPVSMTNAIRTLLDFGLFEYVADRVAKGIEQLEATATKAV